jgi:hypothetical protein
LFNGVALNWESGSYQGHLGGATYSAYSTDGTNSVYLADGTYAINATGNSYFSGDIAATTFNSVPLTNAGAGTDYLADDGTYKSIDLSGYLALDQTTPQTTVGTFTFPVVNVDSGTVSLPPYSFTGDSNTGMYRGGADILGLATGGVARLYIDNAGDVMIGGTSPIARLDVKSSGVVFHAQTGGSSSLIYVVGGQAYFSDGGSNVINMTTAGGTEINKNNASTVHIHTGNAAGVGLLNIGSLTSYFSGNVGIGTSSPSAKTHIISTTEQLRLGYDTSNYFSTTIGSTGITTFDAVGSASSFVFSDPVTINGNLTLGTAGNKINITEGTNATVGVATLVAGTVTVNTTAVTANSRIFLTRQTTAGTLGTSVDVTARTAGTSFTITSNGSVLDTSTVAWLIIN